MCYNVFASYAALVTLLNIRSGFKSIFCIFLSKVIEKLDPLDQIKGCNALDPAKENRDGTQQATGSCEEKRAAVQAEIKRVNQLPANSSYASHRMRVLNKVLELMSIKRTKTQDEELELLFAGLSI